MKFFIFLILPSFLMANENTSAGEKPSSKTKNIKMEFDGRSIDGDVISPNSADIDGDKNIKFDPLLDGKKDFQRELRRSSGAKR
jgi:hypothetical protein